MDTMNIQDKIRTSYSLNKYKNRNKNTSMHNWKTSNVLNQPFWKLWNTTNIVQYNRSDFQILSRDLNFKFQNDRKCEGDMVHSTVSSIRVNRNMYCYLLGYTGATYPWCKLNCIRAREGGMGTGPWHGGNYGTLTQMGENSTYLPQGRSLVVT